MEDGSLLIAKVRSTDRGKYTCVRANEAGSVRGTAWLSVLVRTQIIQVTLLLEFKKNARKTWHLSFYINDGVL